MTGSPAGRSDACTNQQGSTTLREVQVHRSQQVNVGERATTDSQAAVASLKRCRQCRPDCGLKLPASRRRQSIDHHARAIKNEPTKASEIARGGADAAPAMFVAAAVAASTTHRFPCHSAPRHFSTSRWPGSSSWREPQAQRDRLAHFVGSACAALSDGRPEGTSSREVGVDRGASQTRPRRLQLTAWRAPVAAWRCRTRARGHDPVTN